MGNFGSRQLAASFFGLLGLGTILLNVLAIIVRELDPEALIVLPLSLLYGITASLTGYGLWKRSRLAAGAFLGWSATIVAFMTVLVLYDPSLVNPWQIPSALLLIAAFYFGWRKIRRTCAHAV